MDFDDLKIKLTHFESDSSHISTFDRTYFNWFHCLDDLSMKSSCSVNVNNKTTKEFIIVVSENSSINNWITTS